MQNRIKEEANESKRLKKQREAELSKERQYYLDQMEREKQV